MTDQERVTTIESAADFVIDEYINLKDKFESVYNTKNTYYNLMEKARFDAVMEGLRTAYTAFMNEDIEWTIHNRKSGKND